MDGTSGRLAVQDERRGFPIMEDWADEHEMLRHCWALLDEYSRVKDIPSEVTLKAEECRYRQYLIQCLEDTVSRNGYLDDARSFVESRIRSGTSRNPPGFDSWWKRHKTFLGEMPHHNGSGGDPKGKHKCFDIQCKHYAYGFDTVDDQERHLNMHHFSRLIPGPAPLQRGISNPSGWRHSQETEIINVDDDDNPRSSPEPGDPIFQIRRNRRQQSIAPATGSKSFNQPRRRTSPIQALDSIPCLRCKILKKGCDYQLPCSECPVAERNSSDYWKALGCFHAQLINLIGRCFPEHMEQIPRIYEDEAQHAVAIVPYPGQAKEFDHWGSAVYVLFENHDFRDLRDECWEDLSTRAVMSSRFDDALKITGLTNPSNNSLFNDLGVALGLLNLGYLDPTYLGRTAYNPFTVLRIGNMLANRPETSKPWEFFLLAKVLLLDVIRLYRQERQIPDLVAGLHFNPSVDSNQSQIPLPLPDVRRSLSEFLSYFDQFFSQRTTLTAERWLEAFYAIVMFSITKSLLIDTLYLRGHQGKPTRWNASDANQIISVYKVLVSVFMWSAKINSWCPKMPAKGRDPLMLGWESDEGEAAHPLSNRMRWALGETRKFTRQGSWLHGGIKSSKDFLMALGTGDFLDMGFNGFLPQRYGSKLYRKEYRETTRKLLDGPSVIKDFAFESPYSIMDFDTRNEVTSKATETTIFTAPNRFLLEPRSELVSGGVSRANTFPQPFHGRESSTESRSYLQAGSREARQVVTSGTRRSSPYNIHHKSSSRDDPYEYYSAPSPTNTTRSLHSYSGDNQNGSKVTARTNMYPIQGNKQAFRQDIAEKRRRETGQAPFGFDCNQISHSGNNLDKANASHAHNQEHVANTGDPRNLIGSDDQFNAKRVCTIVEDNQLQRSESVIMDIDNGQAHLFAEPRGITSKTTGFFKDGPSITHRRRKALSKEQREHAAKLRKLGACESCKKRKVKCDPSHSRENVSTSPQQMDV